MNYDIILKKRASKALESLPREDYPKVRDAIRELAENPRPNSCLKLTGREGWRIRIGVYRIVYTINDKDRKVTILDLGHRRDIYR